MHDPNGHWFKVYCKITESWVFKDPNLLKVWVWCLSKASYKERWVPVKAGRGVIEVHLKPGQFIFGRHSAALELDMKPESVRKRLHRLLVGANVTIESTTKFSIVTICNWGTYQNPKSDEYQLKYQPSTNQVPQTRKKEGEEQEKGSTPPPKNTHISVLPGFEDCLKEEDNGKPKTPQVNIKDYFELFWKAVRAACPRRSAKKEETLKRYREAIPKVKDRAENPHEFLLLTALAYYESPLGKSKWVVGPAPWLYQGRWDDDPASWQMESPNDPDEDEPVNWG